MEQQKPTETPKQTTEIKTDVVQEQPKAVEVKPETVQQQPATEVKAEVVQEQPKTAEPLVRPTDKVFEIKEDSIFVGGIMRAGKGYGLKRTSDTTYQVTGIMINNKPAFDIPYPLTKELADQLYNELLQHEIKFSEAETLRLTVEKQEPKEVFDSKKYEGIPLSEVDLRALAENLPDASQQTQTTPPQTPPQPTFQVVNPSIIPNPAMGSNIQQQQQQIQVPKISEVEELKNHADTMLSLINSHWRIGMGQSVTVGEILPFINSNQKVYKHDMKKRCH